MKKTSSHYQTSKACAGYQQEKSNLLLAFMCYSAMQQEDPLSQYGSLEETFHLEEKETPNPDPVAEASVAFNNADGGTILCGIREGKVVGVEKEGEPFNEDRVKTRLINSLRQLTSGLLFTRVSIRFIRTRGHVVCAIEVPASKEVCYYRNELVVRVDNTSQHLRGAAHTAWIMSKFNLK